MVERWGSELYIIQQRDEKNHKNRAEKYWRYASARDLKDDSIIASHWCAKLPRLSAKLCYNTVCDVSKRNKLKEVPNLAKK